MKQKFKVRDQVILKSGGYYWIVYGYNLDLDGKETTIALVFRYSENDKQYRDEIEQDLLELLTEERREELENIREGLAYLKFYIENR